MDPITIAGIIITVALACIVLFLPGFIFYIAWSEGSTVVWFMAVLITLTCVALGIIVVDGLIPAFY